jgi:hypothetical protein
MRAVAAAPWRNEPVPQGDDAPMAGGTLAQWFGVFKPGRPFRRTRHDRA